MKDLESIYEMELSNIGRKQVHLLRRRRRLIYVLNKVHHKSCQEIADIMKTSRQYISKELQYISRQRTSDGEVDVNE